MLWRLAILIGTFVLSVVFGCLSGCFLLSWFCLCDCLYSFDLNLFGGWVYYEFVLCLCWLWCAGLSLVVDVCFAVALLWGWFLYWFWFWNCLLGFVTFTYSCLIGVLLLVDYFVGYLWMTVSMVLLIFVV